MADVAIDFGAAGSKAAYRADSGRLQLVRFAPSGAGEFPTAAYLSHSGKLYVGERAMSYAGRASDRLVTRIKHQLQAPGDVTPKDRHVFIGDREIRLVEIIAEIFNYALLEYQKVSGGRPAKNIILTHPVNWADAQEDALASALALAGHPRPAFTTEPAAAAAFAFERGLVSRVDGAIAVFDLGASTFDAAVIEQRDDGAMFSWDSDGRIVGGDDFDSDLLDLVEGELDGIAAENPGADHALAFRRWREEEPFRLAREARRIKEMLSTAEEAVFAFGGQQPDGIEVEVRREDFEERIAPRVQECLAVFEGCLDSLPKSAALGAVVGTGGSAHVPYVRERLEEIAQQRNAKLVLPGDEEFGAGQVVAPGAVQIAVDAAEAAEREEQQRAAARRAKAKARKRAADTRTKSAMQTVRSSRLSTESARKAILKNLPANQEILLLAACYPPGTDFWDRWFTQRPGVFVATDKALMWSSYLGTCSKVAKSSRAWCEVGAPGAVLRVLEVHEKNRLRKLWLLEEGLNESGLKKLLARYKSA
jgi:molecular chaperone DnaK (HSP70)